MGFVTFYKEPVMSDTPPLKRHPSLVPFSRDHYVGLVQAQHLIKSADGSDVDRRKAVTEFLDAWAQEIAPHFDDEERLLTALIDNAADLAQFRKEHGEIRALAQEAKEKRQQIDPGAAWVRDLGQRLNDHIRWEERHLFPCIESSANADQLKTLAGQTEKIEAGRPRSACRQK
jgi:hemerythrin-like domain-containing protein